MKNVILILSVLFLGACSAGGGGSTPTANLPGTTPTVPGTPVTPGLVSTPVSITYYSVTHTVSSVPFTASCTTYNSFAYCWDDGVKLVGASNHYSYWQVTSPGGSCSGNCTSDALANRPTLVTGNVLTYMVFALFSTTPSQLLASGTPTTVACTLTGSVIDCGSFTIDINQVPM